MIRSQPFDRAASDIINGRLDVDVFYLRVLFELPPQHVCGMQSIEPAGRVRVAFFPHGFQDIIRDLLSSFVSALFGSISRLFGH